jgi:hypothetical protein
LKKIDQAQLDKHKVRSFTGSGAAALLQLYEEKHWLFLNSGW